MTTSSQLRHIRKYHPRLPTNIEQEEARLREFETTTPQTNTSFSIAATQAATAAAREGHTQFDNKVQISI